MFTVQVQWSVVVVCARVARRRQYSVASSKLIVSCKHQVTKELGINTITGASTSHICGLCKLEGYSSRSGHGHKHKRAKSVTFILLLPFALTRHCWAGWLGAFCAREVAASHKECADKTRRAFAIFIYSFSSPFLPFSSLGDLL